MQVIADFFVHSTADMEEKLNAAVKAAQTGNHAQPRCGLLVMRHDFHHFSVALSPKVPFGSIIENDFAARPHVSIANERENNEFINGLLGR